MEPVSPPSLLCLVTLCIETGVSCVSSAQRDQTQPSVSNETALVKSASCPFSCGWFTVIEFHVVGFWQYKEKCCNLHDTLFLWLFSLIFDVMKFG